MTTSREIRPESGGADSNPRCIAAREHTISSRQVSWWDVHEYVQPSLDSAGPWPTAGTPAWCALDDDDPAKLAALLDAAQHHVLRVETAQAALAEASRAVAAGADWPALAAEIVRGRAAYIPREKAS